MKIAATYSHLNSVEYLLVHRKALWKEVKDVIEGVDASKCVAEDAASKSLRRQPLYSTRDLGTAIRSRLSRRGWQKACHDDWVTKDEQLTRKTAALPAGEQKSIIEAAGKVPFRSIKQTDFVKHRVAIEVQFGMCEHVAYDLFVKHMAFFIGNQIDVGIEVLPMKSLEQQMSSGVPYYEGEFYNVIRQGRSAPAVPVVLIGIEP